MATDWEPCFLWVPQRINGRWRWLRRAERREWVLTEPTLGWVTDLYWEYRL